MKRPDDCTVRVVDLPVDCGGMVSMSSDGHYSIFLNARLSHAAQQKKFNHEIAHIENDDFNNDDDIRTVEARADGLPSPLKSIPHLMRASDLLPLSQSLPQAAKPPVQGVRSHALGRKVAERSEVGRDRSPISPHQAAVLVHAINDLDDWLFRDTTYAL